MHDDAGDMEKRQLFVNFAKNYQSLKFLMKGFVISSMDFQKRTCGCEAWYDVQRIHPFTTVHSISVIKMPLKM